MAENMPHPPLSTEQRNTKSLIQVNLESSKMAEDMPRPPADYEYQWAILPENLSRQFSSCSDGRRCAASPEQDSPNTYGLRESL